MRTKKKITNLHLENTASYQCFSHLTPTGDFMGKEKKIGSKNQSTLLALEKIGFLPKNGTKDILIGSFKGHKISIDTSSDKPSEWRIDYNGIQFGRQTTANLSQKETLVVLHAVKRLLEIGYDPKNIILEHTSNRGFIDIFVYDEKQKDSYLLIECKTAGKEFKQEKEKLLGKRKNQLFDYFATNPKTKYIILYTCEFNDEAQDEDGEIISEITEEKVVIDTTKLLSGVDSQKILQAWDGSHTTFGIIEPSSQPYIRADKAKKWEELSDLTHSTGKGLALNLKTILRKYSVSDKTNAFNKIFNLFICKITDEDQKKHDRNKAMDFWVKSGDEEYNDKESGLLKRLNGLYRQGLNDYLNIQVNPELMGLNNEFAFIDVYNHQSAERNYKILKEMVATLQGYKLRASSKQQFMGDLFEDLLTTGLKQEAGQFFTPIPLTRFLCQALPIKEIIDRKIKDPTSSSWLPYSLDYASGSGHFLVELMDTIQNLLGHLKLNPQDIKNGQTARKFKQQSAEDFGWAGEYIYGIELDYRLAKVSQVSTFLNGDGDAAIITGNGLDEDIFKDLPQVKNKGNGFFDCIVANPPYSVQGFKNVLQNPERYETCELMKDNSKVIECAFIERTNNLLKEKGVAGIIVPVSILDNTSKVHEKAREILLRNFKIRTLMYLQGKTFSATSTKTVILFIEKRSPTEYQEIRQLVEKALSSDISLTINNEKNAIPNFLKENKLESIDSFKMLLEKSLGKDESLSEAVVESIGLHILTKNENTLIISAPDKDQEQERFLGYSFSNRKGSEGISIVGNGKGKLFSTDELIGCEKLVESSFSGKVNIPAHLQNEASLVRTADLLNSSQPLEYVISKNTRTVENSIRNLADGYVPLNQILTFKPGFAFKSEDYTEKGKKVLTIKNVQDGFIDNMDKCNRIAESSDYDDVIIKSGNTVMSLTGDKESVGRVAVYIGEDVYLNQRLVSISSKNDKEVLPEFVELLLRDDFVKAEIKRMSHGAGQQNVSHLLIEKILVQVPEIEEQKKLINKYQDEKKKEKDLSDRIQKTRKQIVQDVLQIKNSTSLEDILDLCPSGQTSPDNFKSDDRVLGLDAIESITGRIIRENLEPADEVKSNKNTTKSGRLIMNKMRIYLGKFFVSTDEHSKLLLSPEWIQFEGKQELNDRRILLVLKELLLSEVYMNQLNSMATGQQKPRTSGKSILKLSVPFDKKTYLKIYQDNEEYFQNHSF